MAGKPQTLSKGQTDEVISIFRKHLLAYGLAFLAIFTGVTGLSLWGIKKQVEKIAVQRISKQFEEPHISNLMKQVAEEQSKSILEQQVNPEVTRFKTEISSKIEEFDNYFTELKTKYEEDYALLSSEVKILQKRNEIMKLGDLGTQAADRSALEELEKISSESEDASLKTAANSEIARIKSFWMGITRLKGQKFTKNGEAKEEKDFKTEELIQEMLFNPKWNVRALAAQALSKRKEKGVPEALIKCVKNDRNLEVIKDSMNSFERVTGYDSPDVFSSSFIEKWWDEHGEETTSKLKDSNPIETEPSH